MATASSAPCDTAEIASQPAIADYALIGDCRTAALVSSSGSLDWLCLPHFSGPSLHAAILDPRGGGCFAITPVGPFTSRRRYLDGSAVLATEFATASGSARLTDGFIVGSSGRNLEPMREIVRVVEAMDGAITFDVRWAPRPDYARRPGRLTARGRDWACSWRDEIALLRSEQALSRQEDGVGARIALRAGERACFSLSYEKSDIAVLNPLGAAAAARLERTIDWWRGWLGACRYAGRRREAVLRSAVTLKLMTFPPSGAVVAAPTTSLPEWIGASRNWDYRYCWLRDAALTMRAFTGLGLLNEAGAFLRWLLHATALTRPRLQVVYDLFGRARLPETELRHLAGYRGSAPVRIGNGAYDQLQLDVYGGVIAAAAEFVASGGTIQGDQKRLLAGFADIVCRIWRQPDHGIWEVRGAKRHHTFSKLMCWVALDRLLAVDRVTPLRIDAASIERERDAIADAIEARGFNTALGSYVGELDGDWLDAALVLMPCLGYRDPADPRLASTFARIDERLGRDELVFRYERRGDYIEAPEGAFGICSFWAVENLARRGVVDEAEARFERLLRRANDVGLYSEEIDPASGAALGNFPQAFTHVGLINAVLAIEKASQEQDHGLG